MANLRFLSKEDFLHIIGMPDALEAVEEAYRCFSRNQAGIFPVIVHKFEPGKREMDLKSGHVEGSNVFGMKMLGWCSENQAKGLDPLSGVIVLMDVQHQQLLGILNGTPVTALRTGAAGGIGARALARGESRRALIVGAGTQGRMQLQALSLTMPGIHSVEVTDLLPEAAEKYVREQQPLYPHLTLRDIPFSSLEKAAGNAEIIVGCTRSRKPYLKASWIAPGTHINAIGADMPGKQELEAELLKKCHIVGDSRAQVLLKGECQHGTAFLNPEEIGEIGDVLEGKTPGRSSEEEITLFDATGMAIQDIMLGKTALEKAAKTGTGTVVTL